MIQAIYVIFCEAFRIPLTPNDLIYIMNVDAVINLVENNPEFVKQKKIDPVYEAVNAWLSELHLRAACDGHRQNGSHRYHYCNLNFAMALRYPEGTESLHLAGETHFMKNALVFAPGTTIIESLREISDIPYWSDSTREPTPVIFSLNLKITYPQTGAKDIQVQTGSTYNIIVTNTEKIALRANVKKRSNQTEFEFEEKKEQAEFRSKPPTSKNNKFTECLGVFSDEAHHTYGNKIDTELKRVRETVNYINEKN